MDDVETPEFLTMDFRKHLGQKVFLKDNCTIEICLFFLAIFPCVGKKKHFLSFYYCCVGGGEQQKSG